MNPQTLSALMLLNDLRHAGMEDLREKHKMPALLLFYSFIDVCAFLTEESPARSNRESFESYLREFATLTTWRSFTPYDLWAARCSLLHTYSSLGNHTQKVNGAGRILYFAWPENSEIVRAALEGRGCTDFHLMDVTTIRTIAVDAFNEIWRRVKSEKAFELNFRESSQHLLRDRHHMRLEDGLRLIDDLTRMRSDKQDV